MSISEEAEATPLRNTLSCLNGDRSYSAHSTSCSSMIDLNDRSSGSGSRRNRSGTEDEVDCPASVVAVMRSSDSSLEVLRWEAEGIEESIRHSPRTFVVGLPRATVEIRELRFHRLESTLPALSLHRFIASAGDLSGFLIVIDNKDSRFPVLHGRISSFRPGQRVARLRVRPEASRGWPRPCTVSRETRPRPGPRLPSLVRASPIHS